MTAQPQQKTETGGIFEEMETGQCLCHINKGHPPYRPFKNLGGICKYERFLLLPVHISRDHVERNLSSFPSHLIPGMLPQALLVYSWPKISLVSLLVAAFEVLEMSSALHAVA